MTVQWMGKLNLEKDCDGEWQGKLALEPEQPSHTPIADAVERKARNIGIYCDQCANIFFTDITSSDTKEEEYDKVDVLLARHKENHIK